MFRSIWPSLQWLPLRITLTLINLTHTITHRLRQRSVLALLRLRSILPILIHTITHHLRQLSVLVLLLRPTLLQSILPRRGAPRALPCPVHRSRRSRYQVLQAQTLLSRPCLRCTPERGTSALALCNHVRFILEIIITCFLTRIIKIMVNPP